MNPELQTAIILGVFTLLGAFIGALISYWATARQIRAEDKRRQNEKVERAAETRLDQLYDPLVRKLEEGSPDEFDPPDDVLREALALVDKRRKLASQRLLRKAWDVKAYLIYNQPEQNSAWKFYQIARSEFTALKKRLGYGEIEAQ